MKLSEDLSCAELVELVTEYLEGALAPRDRERFEEHVVFCRGCSNFLGQLRTTIEIAGRLTEADLPQEPTAGLLAAFRDWKRRD